MKTLKSILFATDFAPESYHSLNVVMSLARAFDSQVDVLHVIEPLRHFETPALQHSFLQHAKHEFQEKLNSVQAELEKRSVWIGGCAIAVGSVSDSIVSAASEKDIELIALGAGNISANRTVGSTAQSVMEHAEQPVLVIHPDAPNADIRTILCPVDHSSASHRGVRNAVLLAKVLAAKLIVLSVVPEVSWLTAAAEVGELTDAKAEYAVHWGEELDRFLAGVSFDGVDYTLEVVRGVAHEKIIAAARRDAADLIVMGATGRSGLVRVLLGSTTRRVLRDLPCSLLTVREQNVVEEDLLIESDV